MEIYEGSVRDLAEYASISIAYDMTSVLELSLRDGGLGGFALVERALRAPVKKDYDEERENHPTEWPQRFDMSNWGVLAAKQRGQWVGGALVAFKTSGVTMLEGRTDLAVLWDIQVAPRARGRGVGSALFTAATQWAIGRECTTLKVETQNVNVPACRFYARQGCVLGAIDRFAYPDLPDEVQLLWYKDLTELAA